jgi:hypothetical protein
VAATPPPPPSVGVSGGGRLTANNRVHFHVVRFLRNLGNSLKLETDADLDRGCGDPGEKSIVKSRAPTESISLGGKCQPGHDDEIQLRQSRTCYRLANPKSPRHKFGEGRDSAKREGASFATRVADRMRVQKAEIPQKIQVRFRTCRGKQGKNLFSEKEGVKLFTNPQRSPVPFAWRECLQVFAEAISPARFVIKWRSGIYHCDAN